MKIKFLVLACFVNLFTLQAQKDTKKNEIDEVKLQHAQIGIVDNDKSGYKHTEDPKSQWFANAGFGMFIHWSIASIKEIDLSWPMLVGTQMIWTDKKPTQDSIDRYIKNGDFLAGKNCTNNNCITPNEYWEQIKYFNPTNYNPEDWAKAAKAAGMTYMVFTTRHHDGFAMWPSKFGNYNTKNYMGGKDLVRPFVDACRKYGLKVGLYYSGPDWYFNREFQSFMYWGVHQTYKNIPSVDANLNARTTVKTEAESQAHYDSVAVYLKGQLEELLTNYGRVDMIWFDGAPDIPKGNKAWEKCITMKQLQELQPGIIVSPRFFGYGDYKTFEGRISFPKEKQKGWAEYCNTVSKKGWGYTSSPIKSAKEVLSELILCRSRNTNYLLNFGPTKEGVFSEDMNRNLKEVSEWMKINGESLSNCFALNDAETASLPATAKNNHRYLFLLPDDKSERIQLNTGSKIKRATLMGKKLKINFETKDGVISISTKTIPRTNLADVIDIEINYPGASPEV